MTTTAGLPRPFPLPLPAPAVPPRREVPPFPPIRRGGGRGHRLRQALRHRPGVPAVLLLAVAAALAFGPARAGLPPPATAPVHRTGCPSESGEDHP
ncbi:hypothetical protein [Kitasatospora sp. NPDC047058]|uniref:hypothetical protein n=1 Tax=Kitasatospora sp. NPDC047058 TaxID=3155620 RepID=UPI00340EBE43